MCADWWGTGHGGEPKTMASLSSQYEKADTCGLDFIFICLKTDFFKRSFFKLVFRRRRGERTGGLWSVLQLKQHLPPPRSVVSEPQSFFSVLLGNKFQHFSNGNGFPWNTSKVHIHETQIHRTDIKLQIQVKVTFGKNVHSPSSRKVKRPIWGKSLKVSRQMVPAVLRRAMHTWSCLTKRGRVLLLSPVFLSTRQIKACKRARGTFKPLWYRTNCKWGHSPKLKSAGLQAQIYNKRISAQMLN